jgi:hypothetical protein
MHVATGSIPSYLSERECSVFTKASLVSSLLSGALIEPLPTSTKHNARGQLFGMVSTEPYSLNFNCHPFLCHFCAKLRHNLILGAFIDEHLVKRRIPPLNGVLRNHEIRRAKTSRIALAFHSDRPVPELQADMAPSDLCNHDSLPPLENHRFWPSLPADGGNLRYVWVTERAGSMPARRESVNGGASTHLDRPVRIPEDCVVHEDNPLA